MQAFRDFYSYIDNLEEENCFEFAELVYHIYAGNYLQLFYLLQDEKYQIAMNQKPYFNWYGNIGFAIVQSFNTRLKSFHGCLENRKPCNMLELFFLFKSFGLNYLEKNYYNMIITDDLITDYSHYNDKKMVVLLKHLVTFYNRKIRNGDVIFEF